MCSSVTNGLRRMILVRSSRKRVWALVAVLCLFVCSTLMNSQSPSKPKSSPAASGQSTAKPAKPKSKAPKAAAAAPQVSAFALNGDFSKILGGITTCVSSPSQLHYSVVVEGSSPEKGTLELVCPNLISVALAEAPPASGSVLLIDKTTLTPVGFGYSIAASTQTTSPSPKQQAPYIFPGDFSSELANPSACVQEKDLANYKPAWIQFADAPAPADATVKAVCRDRVVLFASNPGTSAPQVAIIETPGGNVLTPAYPPGPNSGAGVPQQGENPEGSDVIISRSSGVLGTTYTNVTLASTDCTKFNLKGLDLVAPSGLTISNPVGSDDGCAMSVDIEIDSRAPLGKVALLLEGTGGTQTSSASPGVAQNAESAPPPNESGGSAGSKPSEARPSTTPSSANSASQAAQATASAPAKTAASSATKSTAASTKRIKGTISFEIVAATPGAIPPGLSPQVDVTWTVLPDNIAKDNFGGFISRRFFCVQLAIGNNSGYPIQISDVHFSGIPGSKLASVSYRAARASLERGQKEDLARRFQQAATSGFGIATAVLPLANAGAATAEAILAVLGNATPGAIELAFPDLTTDELNRLDDQTLRDGLIVPNNSTPPMIVKAFVPKSDLASLVPDPENLLPRATALIDGAPKAGDVVRIWINNTELPKYTVCEDKTPSVSSGQQGGETPPIQTAAASTSNACKAEAPSMIAARVASLVNTQSTALPVTATASAPVALPVIATASGPVLTVTLNTPINAPPIPRVSFSAAASGSTTIAMSGPFLVKPVPTECVVYSYESHVRSTRCLKRTTTDEVARALGQLDFTGALIDYKARIDVQSNPTAASGPATPTPVAVTISPASATVQTGMKQPFTATVTGSTNTAVTWGVRCSDAGKDACGTIDPSSGVYTAPNAVPKPDTVTVTATSTADATKSGSASVTVTAKAPSVKRGA
jgi:hypothetical protein